MNETGPGTERVRRTGFRVTPERSEPPALAGEMREGADLGVRTRKCDPAG